jgi:hypothetical protein
LQRKEKRGDMQSGEENPYKHSAVLHRIPGR